MFEPFRLKGLTLRNRVVMAPMTRCFCPDGVPTAEVAAYYARRARGEVGLILTEGTWVDDPAAPGYPGVPRLHGADAIEGWRGVTAAVHAEGGAIFAQLWHVGAYRNPGFDPERRVPSVGASATPHPRRVEEGDATPPQALSDEELQDRVERYARTAKNAVAAGFDGIEIHAAHGYFLDQFFWKRTNPDPARAGFPAEVVRAARAAVGPDFPIGLRFSQWKLGMFDERVAGTPAELEAWLTPLRDAGVDVFHASTYRLDRPEFAGSTLNLAGWAKKLTGKPAISVGGVGVDRDYRAEKTGSGELWDDGLSAARRRLEAGEFDLVAVGRALIADPEWAKKVRLGRHDEIRPYERAQLAALV